MGLPNAWHPTSEAELAEAIDAGVLRETHFLDFKQEIGRGSRANRELAKDLASFAIDGGQIFVGIAEQGAGSFALHPVSLEGLRERIDQVARSACEPPLAVRVWTFPSDVDPSMGYIVISVPPSPLAPHMVDGSYFGRSDSTKYVLPDNEVLRLHERRQRLQESASVLLAKAIGADPVPEIARRQAHLFIVAHPLAAPEDLALEWTHGPGWEGRFRELLACGQSPGLLNMPRFSPDWGEMSRCSRRSIGVAASTSQLEGDRTIREDSFRPEDILEVQLSEGGSIVLFLGRLSDTPSAGPFEEQADPVIFDEAAVLMTRRVLAMARGVADRCGYVGSWVVGVAATGIAGLAAYEAQRVSYFREHAQRYDSGVDEYRCIRTVGYEDLTHHPGSLTEQLWGRFLRALNRSKAFEETYFKDGDLPSADDLA